MAAIRRIRVHAPKGPYADALLAGVVFVLGLAEALTAVELQSGRLWLAIAGLAGLALALAFRRRVPLATVAAVAGVLVVMNLLGLRLEEFVAFAVAILVAVYTAALWLQGHSAVLALGLALLGAWGSVLLGGGSANDYAFAFLLVAGAWAVGRALRARLDDVARLTRETVLLERERDARAGEAVAHERAEIARELHDILAHSLSVMTVQAAGAERYAAEPRVREALARIQELGRQSLAEIAGLVGVLREDHVEVGLSPPPALADIAPLVERARSEGLPVQLLGEGHRSKVAPGVGLAAFRIVQEALTNVRRHAPGAPTTVRLWEADGGLWLEVRNGPAAAPPVAGMQSGGYGLVGLRERVNLYGGKFDAHEDAEGGFLVQALLPLETG